jgi:hypothetical protein
MSEVPTPTRTAVGTHVMVAAAAVMLLAAIALLGPAVEELREEAARSQRGNVLSKVALAAAPGQADSWSPVWDGPGGAVPDYLADTPTSLALLAPVDRWTVTRTAASSLATNSEIEPVVVPPPDVTMPGYFPNWDLVEPVGVRQVPRARRTQVVPIQQAVVKPAATVSAPPSSDTRPLSAGPMAAIAVD